MSAVVSVSIVILTVKRKIVLYTNKLANKYLASSNVILIKFKLYASRIIIE